MDDKDRERLVRVEQGINYMKKKVDTICILHDDVESLKRTQKNVRKTFWIVFVAIITAGTTVGIAAGLNYLTKVV